MQARDETNARLRVLIVEDSVPDTATVVDELRRGGYDLQYERVDTREAMADALDRQTWDIIISGYDMPGFGGIDAMHLVQDRGLDLPFIIVTSRVGEEAAVEAMRAGASDYILLQHLARLVPAIQRELRDAAVRKECARVEAALSLSEDRFRNAIEGLLDAFSIIKPIRDESGRIADFRNEYANSLALRMAGVTLEEFLERPLFEMFPSARAAGVFDGYVRAFDAGVPYIVDAVPIREERGAVPGGHMAGDQGCQDGRQPLRSLA